MQHLFLAWDVVQILVQARAVKLEFVAILIASFARMAVGCFKELVFHAILTRVVQVATDFPQHA